MRFFKKTNIDFMGVRRLCYIGSASIIVIGLVSILFKGVTFGIDFLGGTELLVKFERPMQISEIRDALGKSGMGKGEIKYYGSEQLVLIRTIEISETGAVREKISNALRAGLPDVKFTLEREQNIGPKIGKELRRDAIYAVIASLIVIMLYVAVRFKFIYGVGAVIALFHDVLVTLGIMSLADGIVPGLNMEITLEVIAAFLTLVGVSVNDTVVVFDRIRENLRIHRSMSLFEIMQKSLNETLSRTIITSGTIFMVLVVLLFMGGEVNRGFSFAMTIGIITGTYSSIYIASAIVLDWTHRKGHAPTRESYTP